MEDLWAFLANPENQATLEWVGAAAVAIGGAVWAAFKVLGNRDDGGEQGTGTPFPLGIALVLGILALGLVSLGLFTQGNTITAYGGGVAVGGDVTKSTVINQGSAQ